MAPEICAQVYMDIEYRNHWDSYVNGNTKRNYSYLFVQPVKYTHKHTCDTEEVYFKNFIPELKEIEDEEGNKGIYWQINFPFFMSNRDVSFYKSHYVQRQEYAHVSMIFFNRCEIRGHNMDC